MQPEFLKFFSLVEKLISPTAAKRGDINSTLQELQDILKEVVNELADKNNKTW